MANRLGGKFSCLAIESASQVCSIAACRGGRISNRSGSVPREQSRHIFAAVTDVLDELDMRLPDLDCIAFGCGPGGFTGLRVGAAAVQSLSYGASVPVCRVSSLATMAVRPMEQGGIDVVATCLDARMGEAYLAIYQADDQRLVSTVLEDRLVDPTNFKIDRERRFFAAGPGWTIHKNLFERHADLITGSDFEHLPSADDLLVVAEQRFRTGDTSLPGEALPNYIRDKVTG